jgi:hypothetical protein
VDFLPDDDQKIYFGFCPGNAANGFLSDELELHLGEACGLYYLADSFSALY